MTPDQISLVQDSFGQVAPIADEAATLFYGRLFEIAPTVEALFTSDMGDQGRKLMAALGTVVRSLDDLDTIVPIAQAMALRHVDYGVEPEHYGDVGAALLWTLEQGLGEAYTEDVADAWSTAYTVLADVMVDAAYPSAKAS